MCDCTINSDYDKRFLIHIGLQFVSTTLLGG